MSTSPGSRIADAWREQDGTYSSGQVDCWEMHQFPAHPRGQQWVLPGQGVRDIRLVASGTVLGSMVA